MGYMFLALWLAALAITPGGGQIPPGLSDLSQLEKSTVDSVVGEFNAKPHHHYAYKPVAVRNNEELVVSDGKTVTLEFTIKPTTCKKESFQPEKCPYRKTGRMQTCMACYKYGSEDAELLAQFWDCIPARTPTPERRQLQQRKCEEVQAEQAVHMIGQFSFLKSSPLD